MSNPNKDLEELKKKQLGVQKKKRENALAKHEAEISELEEEDQEKRKRTKKMILL